MEWRFIYRGLKCRYRDQRCEIKALISSLSPNDIAVDVGANKGSYLWSLSRAVPQGSVIAFEPQPVLANYLKETCSSAGLNNVVVECSGVSSHSGCLTLAVPVGGSSSPNASFEAAVLERESCNLLDVSICSLDDYFASETKRIGAIKIDVEGHELSVLQGARKIIAKHSPLIVCECENRHAKNGVNRLFNFFQEQGYDGFFVYGRKQLVPIAEFKPEIHQRQFDGRFYDHPLYCNNFIMRRLNS